jgi:hypothetical protein
MTKLIVAFRNFANAPKKNTTNTKTLFVGDGGQFTDFRFSRGVLETNPGEKREMFMSVIVGRKTEEDCKCSEDSLGLGRDFESDTSQI